MTRGRLAAAFLCATLGAACSGPDTVIPPRTAIHHDDFEYTVQRVARVDRAGERPARGIFYLVTLQVDNAAKRVNHRWGNDVAYVIDATGRQYENDPAAQEALAAVEPFHWNRNGYTTPAGAVER